MSVAAVQSSFTKAMEQVIQIAIEEEKKQIVAKAVAEFEQRVRDIVAKVAVNAANYYTVERCGGEIVIRVKIDKDSSLL